MKITCNNCRELMEKYLCDLPFEWRSQIAMVICKYLNAEETIDCIDIKKCETLTYLSAFTITGREVCIDYKDENGSTVHRCFNMDDVVLNLDPKCIMSQEDWDLLSWKEQIQALIDYVCECNRHYPVIPLYVFYKDGADVSSLPLLAGEYDEIYTDVSTIETNWAIGAPGTGSVTITYGDTVTYDYLEETIAVDLTSSATFWADINNWLLANNFNDITYDGGLDKYLINDIHNSSYIHIRP